METYGDTFGPYIVDADMEDYYSDGFIFGANREGFADPESETYFVLIKSGNLWFSQV